MSVYTSPLGLVEVEDAPEESKRVLESTRQKIGMIPNMYRGMAHSPGLFATYVDGYNRFRAQSGFSPAEQEVVFLTISRYNECSYCMAAHSTLADTASNVPVEVTDAIRDDRPIGDPRLGALSAFTRVLLETGGHPSVSDAEDFLSAGYTDHQVLEIVLGIAVKTLSNYSNHLFATPVDAVFEGRAWEPVARVAG